MSTQSPLPQNDPLLIAFQQLKHTPEYRMLIAFQQLTHTPEYRNAVNWTIKAENESQADGELWFAFAAGWNAREALAATPADPVREAATALVARIKNLDAQFGVTYDSEDLEVELTALKTALEAK